MEIAQRFPRAVGREESRFLGFPRSRPPVRPPPEFHFAVPCAAHPRVITVTVRALGVEIPSLPFGRGLLCGAPANVSRNFSTSAAHASNKPTQSKFTTSPFELDAIASKNPKILETRAVLESGDRKAGVKKDSSRKEKTIYGNGSPFMSQSRYASSASGRQRNNSGIASSYRRSTKSDCRSRLFHGFDDLDFAFQ